MTSDSPLGALRKLLLAHSPSNPTAEAALRGALDHAVGNPGKLVRPRLVWAAATSHGADAELAGRLACAVEYYHLASLMIDDLPCMDDAETRRGKPCAHRVFGEAPTILAALALINRAYGLIASALTSYPEALRAEAWSGLDHALGVGGLIGGQAKDLAFSRGQRSAREVGQIARAKTGALFWLAVYLPAMLGRPSGVEAGRLRRLCLYWGLAFQTLDDLGDVMKTSSEAGKSSGRDAVLVRPNIALAVGVVEAERRLWRLLSLAADNLRALAQGRSSWSYLEHFHRECFRADRVKSLIQAAA